MQGLASFAAMPVEMSVERYWQGGVPFGVIQSFKCEESQFVEREKPGLSESMKQITGEPQRNQIKHRKHSD